MAGITFGDIEFGEDDANIDCEIARANKTLPVFIDAFYMHPQLNYEDFISGRRFMIIGQKGTGKTAITRKIEYDLRIAGAITAVMVFRDEINSKEELEYYGKHFAISINEIKKKNHYLYIMERIIVLLMASQLENIAAMTQPEEDEGFAKKLFSTVLKKPVQAIVQAALDSIEEHIGGIEIEQPKSKLSIGIDPAVAVRRQNEKIIGNCIDAIRASGKRVAIFIDEVHYAYRTGHDHDQDASLVLDLIQAIKRINKKLSDADVNARVYAAIRSEYLEHPLFSSVELHSFMSAYGSELTWSTFPANFKHPMFEIGALRADRSSHNEWSGSDFMKACFANFTEVDAGDFVESTWSKPRDMIRFLRTCKNMFGSKTTLTKPDYSSAFHQSALLAWKEIETGLSSFLTVSGVSMVRSLVSNNSSVSLEKGSVWSHDEFKGILKPIVKKEPSQGLNDADNLFRILYMLGVIYTVRKTKNQPIYHSYHRGQPSADPQGRVAIHRLVAKAFS